VEEIRMPTKEDLLEEKTLVEWDTTEETEGEKEDRAYQSCWQHRRGGIGTQL
jgi:hypothetical protein